MQREQNTNMEQTVQFTYGSQVVNAYFKKSGKNVTCSFVGVLSVNKQNVVISLDGLIPSLFRSPRSIMVSVPLVAGTTLSGTARFVYESNGSVRFITNITDAREYHHTVSWIVD